MELYNYNGFEYPVESKGICDFLIRIGVIELKYEGVRVRYFLSDGKNIKVPSQLLKIPEWWESRLSHYLNTGSIILSYLDIKEIIS
jgi:hypothetical protein